MPDPTRKLLAAVEDLLAAADEETDLNHQGTTDATISSVWIEPVREAADRLRRSAAPTRDAEIEALAERIFAHGSALSLEDRPNPEESFNAAQWFIDHRDAWRERRAEG